MSFTPAQPVVIVDASVAMHILSGNEAWFRIAAEWANSDSLLLAPNHFRAEVANALLRSARIPVDTVMAQLRHLERSGIEPVDRGFDGLVEAVRLADRHGLTVYDALYLQLAIDVDGELATLDHDLGKAARAEAVPLV